MPLEAGKRGLVQGKKYKKKFLVESQADTSC